MTTHTYQRIAMRQLTHSLATMAALTLGTYAMAEHHTDDFVGAEAVIDGAISNGSLNFAVAATGGRDKRGRMLGDTEIGGADSTGQQTILFRLPR